MNLWLPLLIAGAILVGVVLVGDRIVERLSSIEDQLGRVEQRVERAEDQALRAGDQASRAGNLAETAADAADQALGRAVDAEANAAEAARLRETADQLRLQADDARAAAELARVEAEAAAVAASREADQAQAELARIEQERQEELDRLERALGDIVETRRTALGLVMSLGSDAIEFAFDRADLAPPDRELLSRIAGILLTSEGFSVAVYGHTDDVGTAAYNQDLSERRARAVRDYLVEAGVREEIISTVGYGQGSPRVEGSTPEARARNRRVEIAIIDVNIGPAREVAR
jgi:outer membrane protein OmpA-like peptidoglycan-associated protein